MIRTGLPYSTEDMSRIYDEGAIVDMSDIHFPTVEEDKNIRTSFIFLRNTNFNNIELDFSSCSYEDKSNFLKEYLTCDIVFYNELLNSSWLNILFTGINLDVKYNNILNIEETQQFIKDNQDLVEEVYKFLGSLNLYLLSRIAKDIIDIDFTAIEETDFFFNSNAYELIKCQDISLIISCVQSAPLFYSKLFTMENNELFEACRNLDTYYILEELQRMPQEKFKEFLNELK